MSKLAFNRIKGSLNLITGCGSGLGKATLSRFIKQGCGPILGVDLHFDDDYVESLELTNQEKRLLMLKKHKTFDDEIEDSMLEFVNKYGIFDNVINVAGVGLAYKLLSKDGSPYSMNDVDALFKYNTLGTFNVIRLASKYMIKEGMMDKTALRNRCIINTSCISTTKPSLGQTFYAASKSAIDSMTLVTARELSPYNIRCNTINVGYFNTRLLRDASNDCVKIFLGAEASLCPRKLGEPDEFAHLVEKIVENQMINGVCIKIDAGAVCAI